MSEMPFRISLVGVTLLFVATRLYYRYQARRASATRTRPASQQSKRLFGVFTLLAALASALYVLAPSWLAWATLPLPIPVRWLGVTLGGLAVCLLVWVHQTLGMNWAMPLENREGQTLITYGPYRWVRHPLYTTLFVWATAHLLISANAAVGLAWLLPALLAALLTRQEERYLLERFGANYRRYRQRTGRFLPRWRPPAPDRP